MQYFIGIDVGTGSARAGIFDQKGRLIADASKAISLFRPQPHFAQQSSKNIWQSIVSSVREAVLTAQIDAADVKGIGFDATCSMVVLDSQGRSLSISPMGEPEQDTIVWMDHRALQQTDKINQQGHSVLDYVGGKISPEMQTPKLLWLKEHLNDVYQNARYFFDLPDFLTWKATSDDSRSLCSTVCKWCYIGHENRWDESYFQDIGLGDLLDNNARRIGDKILPIGSPLGEGLTAAAAAELGLCQGTAVSVSMIDAHAGGIGVLGAGMTSEDEFNSRIALIGGTSSCHMAIAPEARFVPGVWGPYYSAMVPGQWLNEGGQSATGQLVDYIIESHPAYQDWFNECQKSGITIYQALNNTLQKMAIARDCRIDMLCRDMHMLPYFLGNRSPRANAHLTGSITGLSLDRSREQMALQYLNAIQAIALGTRHIIEAMNQQGYNIDTIMACGGGTKNPLFLQVHANACQAKIILPQEPEAVILGSAMMAASASGHYPSLSAAMMAMSDVGDSVEADTALATFYDAKYEVFHALYDDHNRYQTIMNKAFKA